MRSFIVYTDGSCYYVDRVGGYAWKAIDQNDEAVVGGGGDVDTTISRMELRACIAALDYLYTHYGGAVILLHSDSEYVVRGFTDKRRKRNKHIDLWLWLEELAAKHELVEMVHVKGHADNEHNTEVDKLAGEFRLATQHTDDHATTQS